ncbi:hypothetical protein GM3708_2612 [Geminocystis sp. NIES-3708]|uniref:hypothetical protein n=1 Tax=Geminocystis sp. NIES-3708 TaxID=1615909 RepID=UPI0005FCC324|nr:hypothetical protein [Geminocystis sp. NIES-3708]BAQ62206.1 hypothetical protein GM3708_2612 [Geminocystis sp. NIES-3708]
MTLIYLSQDKILGSFVSAFIGQKLTQNSNKNLINLDYDYPLNITFDILKNIVNNTNDQNLFINKIKNLETIDTLICIFPWIIYHYQNTEKLIVIRNNYSDLKVNLNSINLFINIINLILNQGLKSNKIMTFDSVVSLKNKNETINDYLLLINQMIIKCQPLTEVDKIFKQNIPEDSLALYQSLYAFFSTIYNFESSLKRTLYFSQQSQATSILTGYFLGLYHGYIHIPYQWRSQIKLNSQIAEINQLTQKLVAQWQGKIDNKKR